MEVACHFHNTYGLGLANCYAALTSGVTCFESSFGGLGGCPFTKVPAGNVCTEDLVHSLQRMGLRTDIRLDALLDVAREVEPLLRPRAARLRLEVRLDRRLSRGSLPPEEQA